MKKFLSMLLCVAMVLSLCAVTFAAEGEIFVKVTNVAELKAGDQVIIVADTADYAISTNQKTNNRGASAITKNGNKVMAAADTQIMTLEDGTIAGTFAFNTGAGYLYAASSSSNYLKTEANKSANSSWQITISNDVTTIVAGGSNSRNVMQYNPNNGNPLFAAYASASQKAISIYKLVKEEIDCDHIGATKVGAKESTCTIKGNVEYYFCADCGKYFMDAAYTQEVVKADVELEMVAHNYTGTDSRSCTVCGAYKSDSMLTVAEAIALGNKFTKDTYTADKYYVTGKVVKIENTTYGNTTIEDAEGNQLLIYGTYSADGSKRYDAMDPKHIVGDVITVYGVVGMYNAAQMKNGWVTKIETPECYHSDVTLVGAAGATCKDYATIAHYYCADCDRNYKDEACTQVLESIVDTTSELAEHNYNNTADARKCMVCGFYKPDSILTIVEAIKFGNTFAHNTYTEGKYYVTGVITEVYNTQYGNMKIADADGNVWTVYGTYSADGTARYDAMDVKPVAGDTVTVYGIIGQYSGTSQMKNGWITEYAPKVDPNAEAAAAVDALIDAIGEVTLEKDAAITAAREAYEALSAEGKAMVTKLETLTAAETQLAALKKAAEDKAAAEAVVEQIAALGEITLESKAAIDAARAAFNALTDDQKALVTNEATLQAAEAKLQALQEQADQEAVDQAAAAGVDALIDAIGEVTLEKEAAIAAARAAYDALTDAQKAKVTKLDTLTAAETQLAALKEAAAQAAADKKAADDVAALINKIGTVTKDSEDAIKSARAAYDALTDAQKALVENYETLTGAEEAFKGIANTGDSTLLFVALAMLSMTALVVLVSKKRAF